MDLFNLWSLVILLSAVGFCNGQSVLPAGPLEGVQGKDVTFETIIIPTDVGNFITVSWNFNGGTGLVPVVTSAPKGETVGAGYAGRVTLNSSTGELKLGSLTAKDGGDYAVTMVTNAAVQRTGATLLRVLEPVSAVTITSNLNEAVEFNSTVVLTCSAKGSFLMYKWLNGTAPLVTDGKHVTLSANSTVLTVAGVFRKDLVGPIYCTAFNNLESGNSAPFNLTVTYGPENITMTVTPTAEVQKKGSNITLTCSAQSSPAAVLQWIHNGVPLNVMGPKLVLDNVAVAQSGNYSCMASNAKTLRYLESTTAKFTVVEAISGTKITGPNGTLVAGNSTATLSCQATAGTADTRVWLKNGVALSPSNRVVVSADKSLVTIKPVQKEDSGEYQCKLTNAVSTDSASLKIVISFGPETVSVKGVSAVKVTEPVILKCAAASLPAATYTWKFNGTLIGVMTAEYVIDAAVDKNSGIYTCEASNAVTGLSTSVSHKLSVKEEGTLDDGLTGGQIAGIVIGVLIAIVILIAGVRYMRRKKPPFIRCLRHHEPSEPPPHPLTARCLRLCTLLDCILPGRPLLPGDMERICVCTTYSHYWCPPGLGSRPSPLLSIHQVVRLRHILTWSLLSILCG